MAFKLRRGDVTGFKFLLSIIIMYGIMSLIVYSILHHKFVKPLDVDAPIHRFSEARALTHLRVLSHDIHGRHEGRPGLKEAAKYIKSQLEMLKERAVPNVRIEIEETIIDGSFNMIFLGYSISFGYRNHTNIIMRISSLDSQDTDPSVLVNGHFDSPLGSPGAADCGSCVASMLEIARLTTESGWVPPRPVIFLFNGAEELFMLGTHGFMKTHKWRDTIGAFINIEASGTGGLDLVCQSGPGSWPSRVYAQSAIYPMAHSAAQDVFPVIPGDTDYRMFAQDYGDIPGLDIIFIFGGYFYHTSYDTIDRLIPGSIQARGENLLSIIKAFTNSSELRNAHERESLKAAALVSKDDRAVFFDYLTQFMIFYPRSQALVLHSIPILVFMLMPCILYLPNFGFSNSFATYCDFIKGLLIHALGVILGVVLPITFSILRLMFSSYAMSWFNHPFLAFMMFIPCSVVGLLIPRMAWKLFPLSQDAATLKTSKEKLSDDARFWGAFGFYALLTLVYLLAGLSGGFLTFFVSVSMFIAWNLYRLSLKSFGRHSLKSTLCYVVPMIPCLIYSAYFGGILVQFFIEKMGMMGSLPAPYGYFVPDIVVATIVGVTTGWCMGPIIPICGQLARSSILKSLMHFCILALAVSSQFFPYSTAAPKRVVLQHTYITADSTRVIDSSYDFSQVDSNSFPFLFKYAPDVAKELHIDFDSSLDTVEKSHHGTWLALFPVSFLLFSGCLKFPARGDDILKQYSDFPNVSMYKPQTFSSDGSRRVHLEFSLGSLKEVWVAVLNITGPITSWSFADNILPAPERDVGGPPSYITRLSGTSNENWVFWLEANSSEAIRVEVAVLNQYLVEAAKKLKGLFPDWVDVIAYSSFMSTHLF